MKPRFQPNKPLVDVGVPHFAVNSALGRLAFQMSISVKSMISRLSLGFRISIDL
jgi:hypothetical protein